MDLLTLTHALNGLLMIAFPIIISLFLVRRFHASWWLWWMGAGTFVLSQVGHIPFNAVLTILFQRGVLPEPPVEYELLTNAVILGLSAGLWEEFMRYFTYRWWARQARSWRQGLVLGAGHGGMEAIILGSLVLVTFISMLGLRNADLANMASGAQLDALERQVQVYWGISWPMPLLGALERLLTIPIHLALSLLVLQAFIRQHFGWVWLAVFFHAAVIAAALIVQAYFGNLAAEGTVAGFAMVSLVFIYVLHHPEPVIEVPVTLAATPSIQIHSVDPSPESIEGSRYNS